MCIAFQSTNNENSVTYGKVFKIFIMFKTKTDTFSLLSLLSSSLPLCIKGKRLPKCLTLNKIKLHTLLNATYYGSEDIQVSVITQKFSTFLPSVMACNCLQSPTTDLVGHYQTNRW